jgi:hypothetical protein
MWRLLPSHQIYSLSRQQTCNLTQKIYHGSHPTTIRFSARVARSLVFILEVFCSQRPSSMIWDARGLRGTFQYNIPLMIQTLTSAQCAAPDKLRSPTNCARDTEKDRVAFYLHEALIGKERHIHVRRLPCRRTHPMLGSRKATNGPRLTDTFLSSSFCKRSR